jgi:glycosyltransferase involved in cell wall biosynthesis
MKFDDVTIAMIARNEEKAIGKVINDIKKFAPEAEILIVDSSEDNTARIAKKAGATVLRDYPASGYGPAILKALLTPKRNVIITMDCDDTYPAKAIPVLLAKINAGYDVVGASRISKGKPRNMPLLNYISNKIVNYFASIVYLQHIKDGHSGMKAYRRNVLHSIKWSTKGYVLPGLDLLKSGNRGNALPVELLLKPISMGFKVTEVPIDYKERIGKTKMQKINSFLWSFLRILNARFYRN